VAAHEHPSGAEFAPAIGRNLRRLRKQRALSLERFAQFSGVSRAMLCQIELGKSSPTLNVLWKIARALDVPLSALIHAAPEDTAVVLRKSDAMLLPHAGAAATSRALFPFDDPGRVEFYELQVAPGALKAVPPHPPGRIANLVVSAGALVVEVVGRSHELEAGDCIQFAADLEHVYRNPGNSPAVAYFVVSHVRDRIGGEGVARGRGAVE
jgi:transcriptional regulator with XRE-family HTH domain